jgi:hypothetical protein
VVVEGRVFVRSWSRKPKSWYHTFRNDPQGVIQIGGREFAVRPVSTRSERLKGLIDDAYAVKYPTPGSIQYVKDLSGPESKATTTELVPA